MKTKLRFVPLKEFAASIGMKKLERLEAIARESGSIAGSIDDVVFVNHPSLLRALVRKALGLSWRAKQSLTDTARTVVIHGQD